MISTTIFYPGLFNPGLFNPGLLICMLLTMSLRGIGNWKFNYSKIHCSKVHGSWFMVLGLESIFYDWGFQFLKLKFESKTINIF
jgi:hypothetical protein